MIHFDGVFFSYKIWIENHYNQEVDISKNFAQLNPLQLGRFIKFIAENITIKKMILTKIDISENLSLL